MNKIILPLLITLLSPLIAMASPAFVMSTSSVDPTYKLTLFSATQFDYCLNIRTNSTISACKLEQLVFNQKDLNLAYANRVSNSRQAGQMVKSRYGGKILSINSSNSGSGKGYLVKLVDKKGRVLTVFVDAASGRMMQL